MILKSLGGWEPCLELNYSLSKRRGESDRQDMCAVIQVNWRMTSKCRFLLDVRDGAPSCDCWQVALSRWQCGAWGQGSRGSRGALRGTEGHWGVPWGTGGRGLCVRTHGGNQHTPLQSYRVNILHPKWRHSTWKSASQRWGTSSFHQGSPLPLPTSSFFEEIGSAKNHLQHGVNPRLGNNAVC